MSCNCGLCPGSLTWAHSSLAGSQVNPRRLPSVLPTPPHLRLRLRLPSAAAMPPPPPELPLLARLDLPRRRAPPLLSTALREENISRRPRANTPAPRSNPATDASRSKGYPDLGPS
ncbi:hypothetical protein PVAP13_1NG134538 [Panicum virgatum]|uniref:Uncharacterized protein n=1 Tax=Panicum virgatum TaxID=38727 RepID=A0A8T0WLI3_PANVG|nr:hypothetical protein PVAP13_1NG134538 [Panicum virgatum]